MMGSMGEDAGRFFALQMLDSMEYMHSNRVAHRDLKLENILIDDNLQLKLADFGFACYKQVDASVATVAPSLIWPLRSKRARLTVAFKPICFRSV